MFYLSRGNQELFSNIEKIGLKHDIISKKNVLIKINMGKPAKNRPRTDMALLGAIVNHIYQNGGRCAIAEGSDGYLTENLIGFGFKDMISRYGIKIIDIDSEDFDEVQTNGEKHYIPKCFEEYPVRIAIPAASNREGMIYSNNIKLFVGAVPRKMYQTEGADSSIPRPKIHQNLHFTVANLFYAVQSYSPFQYFINGGLSYNEKFGEFIFSETFIGNDAHELDCHIFQNYFSDCEYPEYLDVYNNL